MSIGLKLNAVRITEGLTMSSDAFSLLFVALGIIVAIAAFMIPENKIRLRLFIGSIFLIIVAVLIRGMTPLFIHDSAQTPDAAATEIATSISNSDLIIVFAIDYSLDSIIRYSNDAKSFGYEPVVYKSVDNKFYAIVNSSSDSAQQDSDLLTEYFGQGVSIRKLSEICPKSRLNTDGKYYLCFD